VRKRGTLEIEAEIKRLKLENEKLDEIILQMRNETRQIENEIERLSELESKLDGLFSKYNISLGAPTKPQQ
jgi:predicted RNase H-like nuclease (RuvC/YqgF family)